MLLMRLEVPQCHETVKLFSCYMVPLVSLILPLRWYLTLSLPVWTPTPLYTELMDTWFQIYVQCKSSWGHSNATNATKLGRVGCAIIYCYDWEKNHIRMVINIINYYLKTLTVMSMVFKHKNGFIDIFSISILVKYYRLGFKVRLHSMFS